MRKKFAWEKGVTDDNGYTTWVPDNDAARAKRDDAEYDEHDKVLRWKSNGSVPPKDCVAHWQYLGLVCTNTVLHCDEVRKREQTAFLAEYVKHQRNNPPSDEELFEMRAAFGEGETVVDVLSGRRIYL